MPIDTARLVAPADRVIAIEEDLALNGTLLSLAATAHQQFLAASAGGHGRENDSAVIKVFQKLTGIDLPDGEGEKS